MSTGQGTTWVLVADAHQARVLEVADAGLLPRLLMTVKPPAPEGQQRSPEHLWRHGDDPRAVHEEQRSVHALVQVLERGLADNQLRHLVLVAPPRMLGVLRESLPAGSPTDSARAWRRTGDTCPTPSCHSRLARWSRSGPGDPGTA